MDTLTVAAAAPRLPASLTPLQDGSALPDLMHQEQVHVLAFDAASAFSSNTVVAGIGLLALAAITVGVAAAARGGARKAPHPPDLSALRRGAAPHENPAQRQKNIMDSTERQGLTTMWSLTLLRELDGSRFPAHAVDFGLRRGVASAAAHFPVAALLAARVPLVLRSDASALEEAFLQLLRDNFELRFERVSQFEEWFADNGDRYPWNVALQRIGEPQEGAAFHPQGYLLRLPNFQWIQVRPTQLVNGRPEALVVRAVGHASDAGEHRKEAALYSGTKEGNEPRGPRVRIDLPPTPAP